MVVDATRHHTLVDARPLPTSRPRRLRLRVAIPIVLALIGLLTWATLGSTALGGVRVGYDVQPLTCEGTDVGAVPSVENPSLWQPAAELRPGMRCELRIQVVNEGWTAVTVTEITLVGLAQPNALRLEPLLVEPNGTASRDIGRDAVFEIEDGVEVAAGATATFVAVISYDGGAEMDGCTWRGWNVPAVTVSSFWRDRRVQPPPEDLVLFLEGSLTDCV